MNARCSTVILCLVSSLVCAACIPPASSASDPDAGPLSLRIGAGDPSNPTAFTELQDGSHVRLTPGNQGGQHVWIALKATGISRFGPSVEIRLRNAAGDLIGYSGFSGLTWRQESVEIGSDPMTAQVYNDSYCALLNGGTLNLMVSVTDGLARRTEATRRLVVDGWNDGGSPEDVAAKIACCADAMNPFCHAL